jgi:hypothetical protein
MVEVEAGQLKQAIEAQHGGAATLAQSVPVCETFEGKTVWGGTVHVFDLTGHPTATRAYAWSVPIEGSTKRRCAAYGADQVAIGCGESSNRGGA